MTGFVVFLKEFIALYYWYIELFTRKILNIHSWITSCPDGITPNSGLTGPRIHIYIYIYVNPSARAGYNAKAILSSLSGLNSEFSFSETGCHTKAKEPSLVFYLFTAIRRKIGLIPFPRILALCEMDNSIVQYLNSYRCVFILRRYPLHQERSYVCMCMCVCVMRLVTVQLLCLMAYQRSWVI